MEDTSVYIVRVKGDDSKARIVIVKLVVWMGVPTDENEENRVWIGTEAALLELCGKVREMGRLEKCYVAVGMGMDMTIYCYEEGKGFFDPPEEFGFGRERVDWAVLPGPAREVGTNK